MKKGCQWCQIYQIAAAGFDNGFFQKFGCCGGGKWGVPEKRMGRGQNIVDEVRRAEKGLVDKIGRLVETLQRSKCSKAKNDKDGNSVRKGADYLK